MQNGYSDTDWQAACTQGRPLWDGYVPTSEEGIKHELQQARAAVVSATRRVKSVIHRIRSVRQSGQSNPTLEGFNSQELVKMWQWRRSAQQVVRELQGHLELFRLTDPKRFNAAAE